MTRSITKSIIALTFVMFVIPANAATSSLATALPRSNVVHCTGSGGAKACLCKGMASCKKLAANCATKLEGGRAPSGGVYGKCNNVLNVKPPGLSSN